MIPYLPYGIILPTLRQKSFFNTNQHHASAALVELLDPLPWLISLTSNYYPANAWDDQMRYSVVVSLTLLTS